MPRIPLFSAAREFMAHRKDIISRIEEVLLTGEVTGGEQVVDLERRLASLANRKHGVAVNSGTDALHFALLATGIRAGDEVLVPDFSFISSGSVTVMASATPIFVDVDCSYNMDLDRAEQHISPKTRGIIFVHLYGQMSEPLEITAFAHQHNLILIEDAAQAIGASFDGHPAGSLGLASCLSFNSTKTISAPGGGGALLTDDDAVAERVRQLRYHGRDADGRFAQLGFNSLMPSIAAAVVNFKLDYDLMWQDRRRQIAAYYREGLANRDDIVLPHEIHGAKHIYHKFVIRHPRRAALAAYLDQVGVETKVHYPVALHRELTFASKCEYDDRHFPDALHFADTVLTLPAHAFLEDSEVETIACAVRQF